MTKELREGMIFGLGNPLLDISADVDSEFLKKWHLDENSAILADPSLHKGLFEDMIKRFSDELKYTAGGAVQNSLRVAQWFLQKPKVCTFMGCIGIDFFGDTMAQKAGADGVNAIYSIHTEAKTGTCAVCITSGGKNRSLVAYLGAANEFKKEHLIQNWSHVTQADVFYVSGFHLAVSPDSILEISKHSEAETSKTMCFNLSAPYISEFFGSQLMSVLPYVDILFGNETEAKSFAKHVMKWTHDDLTIRDIAIKTCDLMVDLKFSSTDNPNSDKRIKIVIITQGADNIILVKNNIFEETSKITTTGDATIKRTTGGKEIKQEITDFPVEKLDSSKIVDTNGAGDAFVGGFLSQFIRTGYDDLNVCLAAGVYGATEIIQLSGCTFPSECKFDPSRI